MLPMWIRVGEAGAISTLGNLECRVLAFVGCRLHERTVLPDMALVNYAKELTNYARIMPEFKFSNYARIMPDFHKLC